MNFKETFTQAFDSLKVNKIRSFLTLLALVIGVFSVIVSTTAVAVLDNFFTNTMSILGSDVITVQRNPAVQMGPRDASLRNRKEIKFEDAENGRFAYEQRWLQAYKNFRGIYDSTTQYARQVAIIGKDVQNEIFKTEYPLQKTIRIDGRQYTVIGILEKKGQIFGQSFDNMVVIPYTTGINAYGGNRGIGIQLRAPEISKVQETIDPVDDNDFEIITNDSLTGTFNQFTFILYFAGFVVGAITLLGAGIGVMNIMLVSVTERTREIGIRKAVGATRKAIVNQFLMEAVFICQIGGLIGLLAGVAAGNIMAVLIDTEPVIPIMSLFISFFGMLFIGLIFGVYPAFKASKLDPIESLRYE